MTKLYSIKALRHFLALESTVAPLSYFFYPMDLRGRGSSWMFRYVVDSKGFWFQKNDKYQSESENGFDVSEIAGVSGLDLDDLELVPFESNALQHSEVQRHPFRYGHPGGKPILPLTFTARQFLWFEKTCLPSPLRDYWFLSNSTTEAEQLAELKKTNHEAAELAQICLSGVAPDEPEEMPTPSLPATTPDSAPVVAERTSDAPAKQADTMKKAALIAELKHEWSSIEADISEATRNELNAAAHTGKHGEWDKDKARAWAVSKGKIRRDAPVHSLAAAWSGPVTRNTIGDQ